MSTVAVIVCLLVAKKIRKETERVGHTFVLELSSENSPQFLTMFKMKIV